VEVTQFGWKYLAGWLAALGCVPALRGGDTRPFVTDNGNYILDCTFPHGIVQPVELAETLSRQPGVVEHGLFLGMANEAIVAGSEGISILN
jgi:ribose 5-phosphate isomerase A